MSSRIQWNSKSYRSAFIKSWPIGFTTGQLYSSKAAITSGSCQSSVLEYSDVRRSRQSWFKRKPSHPFTVRRIARAKKTSQTGAQRASATRRNKRVSGEIRSDRFESVEVSCGPRMTQIWRMFILVNFFLTSKGPLTQHAKLAGGARAREPWSTIWQKQNKKTRKREARLFSFVWATGRSD